MDINRRSFLKATSSLACAAVLPSVPMVSASAAELWTETTGCGGCYPTFADLLQCADVVEDQYGLVYGDAGDESGVYVNCGANGWVRA